MLSVGVVSPLNKHGFKYSTEDPPMTQSAYLS
ncbi:hypothetical protein VCSRO184_1551 [Vibrio cholerae]|nr:hypothetical protein VCSRO184_1551 [Vibrio cholerae]